MTAPLTTHRPSQMLHISVNTSSEWYAMRGRFIPIDNVTRCVPELALNYISIGYLFVGFVFITLRI
jgi:hypothetical protein